MSGRAILLSALMTWTPSLALACPMCQSGDSTVTLMGVPDRPEERWRASLEWRWRTDVVGEPNVDEVAMAERRFDKGLAFAFRPNMMLMLNVPVIYQEMDFVGDRLDERRSLGDVEVRARGTTWSQETEWGEQHLAFQVGVTLPTAPTLADANGQDLPDTLQPGLGTVGVLTGASYSVSGARRSAFGSVTLVMPTPSEHMVMGAVLRGSLWAQHQLRQRIALRAGVDGRTEQPTQMMGEDAPNSGGQVVFAGGDVVLSRNARSNLTLGASAPVYEALLGYHDEGPIFRVGASRAF